MGWQPAEGGCHGTGVALIEGLATRITLSIPAPYVRAWALDERGNRREEIRGTDGK